MEESQVIMEKWEPIPNLPTALNLVSVYDDVETLTILLEPIKPSGQHLRVHFDSHLLYRKGDEGDLLKIVNTQIDYEKRPLMILENSELLRWFYDQQYSDHDIRKITHYFFVTPNDLLDVLALRPPVVEWIPVS